MTGGVMAFARDWVAAFNRRDLEAILAHYAENVSLTSPFYRAFTGGASHTVRGKPALRAYFEAALEHYRDLRFTLLEAAEGASGLCIRYHTNVGDRIALECLEVDPSGTIVRAICHYTEGPARTGEPWSGHDAKL